MQSNGLHIDSSCIALVPVVFFFFLSGFNVFPSFREMSLRNPQ